MPRWLWWAPLAVLVAGLGVWGFRWGLIAASMTETDVIEVYAQKYLERAGEGARLTDCVAYPGKAQGIWLVVRCVPTPHDPSRQYEYHVNRFGGLENTGGPWTGGSKPANRDVPEI